jgi:hypothetical protein
MEEAINIPQKKCDYFSISGEKLFQKKVKKIEKGYFGLPTALEVS